MAVSDLLLLLPLLRGTAKGAGNLAASLYQVQTIACPQRRQPIMSLPESLF